MFSFLRLLRRLLRHFYLVLVLLFIAGLPARAQEMRFILSGNGGNCNGCEWVAADGEITNKTPDRFREFIKQNGRVYHIIFNSMGGNLLAGIELGELIRESGAATSIGETTQLEGELAHLEEVNPGLCASACAFSFMGGVERQVASGSLLGVHQFYSTNNEEFRSAETQALVGFTLLFSLRMGIEPSVIVAASSTNSGEIYFFSSQELIESKLDNSSTETETWRLEPYKDGLVLTSSYRASERQIVDVTLFCRAGESKARILLSEANSYWSERLSSPFIKFTGEYPDRPSIKFGSQEIGISMDDVEFQHVKDGRVSVSLKVSEYLILLGADKEFVFDPDFARVMVPLLFTRVEFPRDSWISAMLKNCI